MFSSIALHLAVHIRALCLLVSNTSPAWLLLPEFFVFVLFSSSFLCFSLSLFFNIVLVFFAYHYVISDFNGSFQCFYSMFLSWSVIAKIEKPRIWNLWCRLQDQICSRKKSPILWTLSQNFFPTSVSLWLFRGCGADS